MLTIDEVASNLKVSRNTIVTLIKKGEIKAIMVGNQYRIPKDQFQDFISASEVKPDSVNAGGTDLS